MLTLPALVHQPAASFAPLTRKDTAFFHLNPRLVQYRKRSQQADVSGTLTVHATVISRFNFGRFLVDGIYVACNLH